MDDDAGINYSEVGNGMPQEEVIVEEVVQA